MTSPRAEDQRSTASAETAGTAGTTAGHRGGLPWPALLTLSGAAFATVTAELLPASLLLEMSAGLGVRPAGTGLLVSVWALTVAVASVPLVRATTRVPRRRLLSLALVVIALATVVTALAPNYGVALGSRVVAATAHGLFWSLLTATAAALVPPSLVGRAVSVVLAGPALAGVAGVPVGAALGSRLGWRAAFAALTALLAAAALAVHAVTGHVPPQPPVARGQTDPARPAVVGVALAGGRVLTGHFALYTYIAPLLSGIGGAGPSRRALLLLVFGAAGVAGIAVAGSLSDRWPQHSLTGVAVAFTASAASLELLGQSPVVAVLVVAIWGLLIGTLPPVFMTRLLRTASASQQATAGAIGVTVLNLGIALGATAGGLTLRAWGPAALPAASAAVIALAVIGLILTPRVPQMGGANGR